MFPRGLKINIAFNLAVFLMAAMVLIAFVSFTTSLRLQLKSESEKGEIILYGVEKALRLSWEQGKEVPGLYDLTGIKGHDAGVLVKDYKWRRNLTLGDRQGNVALENMISQVAVTGEPFSRWTGPSWGIFGVEYRTLYLAVPVMENGEVSACLGLSMPVRYTEALYRNIRHVMFYIVINTLLLTLAGMILLSRKIIRPVHRLVKIADDYSVDPEGMYFSTDQGANEFVRLSKALNNMVNRIARDRNSLEENVRSLEQVNLKLRIAQKEVIRAEKLALAGRLSSGIAHEIGNPLGIVSGYLELLRQDDLTAEEKMEFIDRTDSEIRRIDHIIRQLLDISRKTPPAQTQVSVHNVIHDLVSILSVQPLTSEIRFELDLSAETDQVLGDPEQLRQVFLNLAVNTADAVESDGAGPGKTVALFSSSIIESPDSDGTVLEIIYRDNGPGISRENMDTVFDPFFTTKAPGKGTGLGLYVCLMIIEGMNGLIEVDKHEKGACFRIVLPLSSREETAGELLLLSEKNKKRSDI